ncbi:uncharacterized protein J3R85_003619 [Psidium guajava]|nr:uncharacterized protein J3R85_003619 [Psidium guajava]
MEKSINYLAPSQFLQWQKGILSGRAAAPSPSIIPKLLDSSDSSFCLVHSTFSCAGSLRVWTFSSGIRTRETMALAAALKADPTPPQQRLPAWWSSPLAVDLWRGLAKDGCPLLREARLVKADGQARRQ